MMAQRALEFVAHISTRLDYLLHLPAEYDADAARKWPLILFLHGAGERGSDLNLLKKQGLPRMLVNRPDFPFIVVSPQCPAENWWPTYRDALMALLKQTLLNHQVDPDRVYLTGLSMGGMGAWYLASEFPNRFAAVAPICGFGHVLFDFPQRIERLKNVPVWAFHGAKDSIIPISETENMVKVLQAVNGNVQFTIYPEADHDSWTETYDNPALYAWFLQHKLE